MTDTTYMPKVYKTDGGDELVVADGGKISNDGTQASNIADLTGVTTAGSSTTSAAAINSIIEALEGVGILSGS